MGGKPGGQVPALHVEGCASLRPQALSLGCPPPRTEQGGFPQGRACGCQGQCTGRGCVGQGAVAPARHEPEAAACSVKWGKMVKLRGCPEGVLYRPSSREADVAPGEGSGVWSKAALQGLHAAKHDLLDGIACREAKVHLPRAQ